MLICVGGAFRQEDPLIRFARKQNGLHEAFGGILQV